MSQRATYFGGGLILGLLVGACATSYVIYRFISPDTTLVYTTNQRVHLDNGVVLPPGVDLIHDEEMSEGFTTLTLHVNVQNPETAYFTTRVDPRQGLVISSWVVPSNQPLHPTPTAAEAPASGAGERRR